MAATGAHSPAARDTAADETMLEMDAAAFSKRLLLGVDPSASFGGKSVKAWLKTYQESLQEEADGALVDAIDSVKLYFKGLRDEMETYRKTRLAQSLAPSSSSSSPAPRAWVVQLKEEASGRLHVLTPREGPGGDCRIGRSKGEHFLPPRGVSIEDDTTVSSWHGKVTAMGGRVFYTSLVAEGSFLGDEELARHTPYELRSGMVLKLGASLTFAVTVAPGAEGAGGVEEGAKASKAKKAGGGGGGSSSSSSGPSVTFAPDVESGGGGGAAAAASKAPRRGGRGL